MYDPFGNISGQFRSNVLPPIAPIATANVRPESAKPVNDQLASIKPTSSPQNTTDRPTISSSTPSSTTTEAGDCEWPSMDEVFGDKPTDVPRDLISNPPTSNPSTSDSTASNSTTSNISNNNATNPNPPESELPNEATLNVSPQGLPNEPNEPPRPSTLVKPILNKRYRLSPGMLVKLKNLNRLRLDASADRNAGLDDKLEASASELNTFIKLNTIPTLDTMEISNLISRKNETNSRTPAQTEPTASVSDDFSTTTRPL